MSSRFPRAALAGGSAIVLAFLFGGAARSQQADHPSSDEGTALPEIVVRSPSPIQRPHRHTAQAGRTTAPSVADQSQEQS